MGRNANARGWSLPKGAKVTGVNLAGAKVNQPPAFDFAAECEARGLPRPTPELRFAPPRRWRFDWAWQAQMVALEQEGGVWVRGRHTRGKGAIADMEKYNEASLLGWRLFRVTPQTMETGRVFELLRRVFTAPGGRAT